MVRFRQWLEWLLMAAALAIVSYCAYLRADDFPHAPQNAPAQAVPPQAAAKEPIAKSAGDAVATDLVAKTAGNPLAKTKTLSPRVLFITSKETTKSADEIARLSQPGGDFEKLRSMGWKIGEGEENHLQLIDREKISELVEKLKVTEFPTVACIENGEIVRSFKSGCRTPLDCWTFGFLLKGVDERPKGAVLQAAYVETTNNYPLRGNHWSVEDDWNPTREKVIAHLRGPNHGSQILVSQKIETWSYEELRSLHDDLHEREGVTYGSGSSSPKSLMILNPKTPYFNR